jgi:peptidoglycan/LPS O-acetylase OafA/YrhL
MPTGFTTSPRLVNLHHRLPRTMDNHAEFKAVRFFANLDGIRCFAILAVLWHHTAGSQIQLTHPELNPILGTFLVRGFLGVDVFFVISGFLIVTLLLRERERSDRISLRKFYIRRSLRIFPVYYAFLLGIAAIYFLLKPGDPATEEIQASLPPTLLFLSNVWVPAATVVHVTWSLATEEQFYLVWAPAEKFLPRAALMALLLGVCGLSVAMHFGTFDAALVDFYHGHLPALFGVTFLPIALGVLLAHGMHGERTYRAIARWAGFRGAAMVYCLATLLVTACHQGDLRGWSRPTIQVLMTLSVAALVIRQDRDSSPLSRLLQQKLIARIGVVSYGIYLFHLPIAGFVVRAAAKVSSGGALLGDAIHFTATLGVTWVFAELSFRFFESPFVRLKSKF